MWRGFPPNVDRNVISLLSRSCRSIGRLSGRVARWAARSERQRTISQEQSMHVRLHHRHSWWSALGLVVLLSIVEVSAVFAQRGPFPGAPPRFQPPARANMDVCSARSDDADADKRTAACS